MMETRPALPSEPIRRLSVGGPGEAPGSPAVGLEFHDERPHGAGHSGPRDPLGTSRPNMPSDWTLAAPIALSIAVLASACHGEEAPIAQHSQPVRARVAEVPAVTIDTGSELADIPLGARAGVFVEYHAGGQWSLLVTCDTDESGEPCRWEVTARPLDGALLAPPVAGSLGSGDDLAWDAQGVRLHAKTTTHTDGFSLSTQPGAGLSVEAYLDAEPANSLLRWMQQGVVVSGAPANPVQLTPSAP